MRIRQHVRLHTFALTSMHPSRFTLTASSVAHRRRIGQKKKVQVIKYVMKDSIEEKIYELQKRKKQLSDQLIQAGESFVTQLTMEEIKELFL